MKQAAWKDGDLDRELVAAFVDWYIPRSDARTKMALVKRADIGRTSVYRVINGEESVSGGMLIAVSKALGLPTDALIHIGRHDLRSLTEDGAPAEVIRWVEKQVKSASRSGRAVGQ